MMNLLFKKALYGSAAVMMLGKSAVAFQDDSGGVTFQLEEIIVTAERRAESLQETPVSVLAFSQEKLNRANISSIEELQNFLPNVSIGGSVPVGNSAPNFSIRGIGQASGRANSEKGVGLYIDDVYYPRSTGALLSLNDVESVQVLRGPQGTLFGRNTTGGTINYTLKKPHDEFEAHAILNTGSSSKIDLEGMVNIPLTEKVFFRGLASWEKRDGYIDVIGSEKDLGDQNDYIIRGALRIEASEDLVIDLTASYSRNKNNGSPSVIQNIGTTAFGRPIVTVAAYSDYLTDQGGAAISPGDDRFVSPDGYSLYDTCILDDIARNDALFGNAYNLLGDQLPEGEMCNNHRETDNTFLSADVTYSLNDNLTLRSISGYMSGTDEDQGDFGKLGANTNLIINAMDSFSQELQLSGLYDNLKWIAGLYYFTETPSESRHNRELRLDMTGNAECCNGFDTTANFKTNSYAAFGQATLALNDKFNVTGGIRYSYDKKSIDIIKSGVFRPALSAADSSKSATDSWEAVDFRVTLDYQWTDDLMTYATVSRGFKSGGFNIDITQAAGSGPEVGVYDPETVLNYEAGIRSAWFENKLQVNTTGFYMKFDDMVVQQADFSQGALQILFLNAAKIDVYGFEAEVSAAITPSLTVNANVGHTGVKYIDLNDSSPLFIRASCLGQSQTFENCDVQRLARSPKWSYTIGANYNIPMKAGSLDLSASYAYKGVTESTNSTTTNVTLPSYNILNLRASYQSESFWSVAVYGTNVLDDYYVTSGTNGLANILGTLSVTPARPAEWGLQLMVQF